VTALGRGGVDASDTDVVVVAVPGPAISAALGQVTGLVSKTAIDATHAFRCRALEDLTWLLFAAMKMAHQSSTASPSQASCERKAENNDHLGHHRRPRSGNAAGGGRRRGFRPGRRRL
jgi:hypothetical protein